MVEFGVISSFSHFNGMHFVCLRIYNLITKLRPPRILLANDWIVCNIEEKKCFYIKLPKYLKVYDAIFMTEH